jgi:hypothetical protein
MTNFKIPKNGISMMPFNFDPKDNNPRNTLRKKLKKVIVNTMF